MICRHFRPSRGCPPAPSDGDPLGRTGEKVTLRGRHSAGGHGGESSSARDPGRRGALNPRADAGACRSGAGCAGHDVDAEASSRTARHPAREDEPARATATQLLDPPRARVVVERDVPERGSHSAGAAAAVVHPRDEPGRGSGLHAARSAQPHGEPGTSRVGAKADRLEPVDVAAPVAHAAHVLRQPDAMSGATVADHKPRLQLQRRRVERVRGRQGVADPRRAEGRSTEAQRQPRASRPTDAAQSDPHTPTALLRRSEAPGANASQSEPERPRPPCSA
jgi:hypothetical protein